jgi:tRNA threonylcarbamoyl adenosine modification protein YeaZ
MQIHHVVLLIRTDDREYISVGFRGADQIEYWAKENVTYTKAQALLPMLTEMLREQHIDLKQISAIEVCKGPGSFTGLRVGFSVANALGLLLGIPVNNVRFPAVATPLY